MQTDNISGRAVFKQIGSPRKIVAPMVDQSELAWRILSRKYGATLCYTPMFHAKLFATSEKYFKDMWCEMDGDTEADRPLVVQFCANDADYLLKAATKIQDRCDAVDLNLGCPQGIARKGKYGAFLMEDWDLIYKLINNLHKNLKIPVTAKIRIYEDKERSLEYAKMVVKAGAQFLTVHGRLREMKGQKTGLANWETIKYIRENLSEDVVFFANGNILYPEDIDRCIEEIKCDGVMSAEGNLFNPGIFVESKDPKERFPRVDKVLREYYQIVNETPGNASKKAMKTHFFKILTNFLPMHTDLRQEIGKMSPLQRFEEIESIVTKVENIVQEIFEKPDIEELDKIVDGEQELWGGRYKKIPYWRCQPYFRPVNGVTADERVRTGLDQIEQQQNKHKKRKAECEIKKDDDDETRKKSI